jgi:hypothetical protein
VSSTGSAPPDSIRSASVHVRDDQVVIAARLTEIEDRDEVAMAHLPRDARLSREALPVHLVPREEPLEHLQRDHLPVLEPRRSEHDPDGPLAEHRIEPVGAQCVAEAQVGCARDSRHGTQRTGAAFGAEPCSLSTA